jgi:hypothetical protein
VGFIIATRLFGIKYDMVAFSHGRIGVAILVLIYSQVIHNELLLLVSITAGHLPGMHRRIGVAILVLIYSGDLQ